MTMETALRNFSQSMNYVLDLWRQNLNVKQPSVITSRIFFIKQNDQPDLEEEIKQPGKNDIKVSDVQDKQLENPSTKLMRSERFVTQNMSTLLEQGWGNIKITWCSNLHCFGDRSFAQRFRHGVFCCRSEMVYKSEYQY